MTIILFLAGKFTIRVNELYDSSYFFVDAVLTSTWFLALPGAISESYEGPVYILPKNMGVFTSALAQTALHFNIELNSECM